MKPIRVLILDDEILAIEHIRRLVPWKELGYEICCVATHPVKALSLVEEFRPQLIIVDIKMPVMDGLEFCKRVLASEERSPKIVLLSSYKEFDYAKEAIQLGLSNYWVKHELNADYLARELILLKKDFEEEFVKQAALRKPLLADLIAGRPVTREQWLATAGAFAEADYLQLAVVQQDRPFPLLTEMTNIGAPIPPAFEQPQAELEDESLLAAIPIRKSQYAFLFIAQGIRSEQKLWDHAHEKAMLAKRAVEEQTGGTTSVAIVHDISDWKGIPSLFHEANLLLSRSVFYGPRFLFRLQNRNDYKVARLATDQQLKEFSENVRTFQLDGIPSLLANLFADAAASKDLAGFTDMCKQLVSIVDQSRETLNLPSLELLWSRDEIDTAPWTSADGIRDWFIREFQSLAEASSAFKSYSRKVTQALEYIRKNYSEDIGAQQIAEHIGISRDHLRHLFKEETGQTVLDALTAIRVDQSKKMLEEGKHKIYEIAELVGYRNSQYFSQVFRKSTGMTPLEYVERKR
ncbi:helix-turn-helix domain-containing protein [Cohnella cholangitidis]|uniref:Helix-turn-helix domain-containing protein n=1 Tax=Cohnella cholangitidis TaxID=2598458 RepID=A0A7G5BV66_9BACL|nr:helix-turn-helix domain-containing protein [Cohnella cholangitidis]QMV40850.1 helix-turn-helix domain-containing protein [Cohnella cholangitidis]